MTSIGHIVLEGGAEFGGGMRDPDLAALELAGGRDARVVVVPTAAAPDDNDRRAGANGLAWFRSLGATHVSTVPLRDRASAQDPAIVSELASAKLIYLLGGFAKYLRDVLVDTPAWRAVADAHASGAVVAGSSAGAMVLCEYLSVSAGRDAIEGLGMVPNACVLPHHDTFGQKWVGHLRERLPGAVLIGIDEGTGLIDAPMQGAWTVHGQGYVTIYDAVEGGNSAHSYRAGQQFHLSR